jgi:enoyl-CoA hydratase/carnithine racemase
MDEPILIEQTGGRADFILNRPDRKNALTGPLVVALRQALSTLANDESVNAVVLRGSGGAFCSGLDLKEFNADPRPGWLPEFQANWRAANVALFRFPKPIVGALERFAINGGAPLAFACDLLVVGEGAYLQVGEIQQGVMAPMNVAWLRAKYAENVALRVGIGADRLGASELLRFGIATEVVADAEVVARAQQLADQLAAHPNAAPSQLKIAVRAFGPAAEDPEAWFAKAAQFAARRSVGPLPPVR